MFVGGGGIGQDSGAAGSGKFNEIAAFHFGPPDQ
jgi:hypothetical protein